MGAHLADWMETELKARTGRHTKSYIVVHNYVYAFLMKDILNDRTIFKKPARQKI